MKRLIYAILTCLFVMTCAFGCTPNMPESNPKYKGLDVEKLESQDGSGGSTETGVTTPDDTTETSESSSEEGTE